MKIFKGLSNVKSPPDRAVVALGNFDGVHIGHRVLIEKALSRASELEGTSVVYTFYPHPVKTLAPASCPALIQTLEQRLEALDDLGVDVCVVDEFSLNLAHMLPKDFFAAILCGSLGAKAIVAGYDFTFGVHRRGTVELMEQMGAERGIGVDIVDAQFMGELLISSTEIRKSVTTGCIEHANELLGRPFALRGNVIRGMGMGQTLGAHTANVDTENEVLPQEGIYVTATQIVGESTLRPSITSLGTNPTFKNQPFKIETHLLDFKGDLVGKRIDILFSKRLRGQVAFDSADTLRDQIRRDIENAKTWHKKH